MTEQEKQILEILLDKSIALGHLIVFNRTTKSLDEVKSLCWNGLCIQLNLENLNEFYEDEIL